jgi:hypothetical protein
MFRQRSVASPVVAGLVDPNSDDMGVAIVLCRTDWAHSLRAPPYAARAGPILASKMLMPFRFLPLRLESEDSFLGQKADAEDVPAAIRCEPGRSGPRGDGRRPHLHSAITAWHRQRAGAAAATDATPISGPPAHGSRFCCPACRLRAHRRLAGDTRARKLAAIFESDLP